MPFFFLFAAALAAELPPDARVFIDDESKLKQLEAIDAWHMKLLAELFGKLNGVQEGGESLPDRSMGTPNNMPVLLAGGGFKHGQHLAFDKFASATGAMRGMEMT